MGGVRGRGCEGRGVGSGMEMGINYQHVICRKEGSEGSEVE